MAKDEVWKDVLGYEGRYQVSDKGNVRSVARKDSIGRKCGGRTLEPRHHTNGYLQVALYKNGKRQNKLIHRLVTEAFIPNPENHPEVNHQDEDKANNNVENLEWCTSRYNTNHGTLIERLSKKVRAVNVETGAVLTFNSASEAGSKGYSQGGVSQACRGAYKNARGKLIGDGHLYRGHQWSYKEENK